MTRGRAVGLGLLALLLVALGVALLRAESFAQRELERAARARYDVGLTIGALDLGVSGATLTDVQVHVGGAASGRIDRITVEASPLALLRDRLAAVRAIRVEGLSLRVRLDAAGRAALTEWTEARRRRAAASTGPRSAASGLTPTVDVRGLVLDVVDEHGALVHAEVAEAERLDAGVSLDVPALRLGGESEDRVAFRALEVDFERGERLRLRRVHAADVAAVWTTAPAEGAARAAADSRLLARLEDAVRFARTLRGPAETDEDAASSGHRLDRLTTPDFTADAEAASISAGRGASARSLAFTGLSIARREGTRLALRGDGRGTSGSQGAPAGEPVSARFDLVVDPIASSAEGRLALDRVPLALLAPLLPELPFEAGVPGALSLDVDLRAASFDRVDFRGRVAVEGAALDHRRIAGAPIRDLAVRLEGEGTLYPKARRLELGSVRLGLGAVVLDWRGRATLAPSVLVVEGRLALPTTSCESALHALPADVLGPLVGFRMSGTLAAAMDISLDLAALDRTTLDFTVDDGCTFLEAPVEADLTRFEGPFRHELLEPDGTEFSMETGPGTSNWVPYEAISPFMVEAVLAHEDGSFFRHRGFAPWAIRDALVRNLREGRYVVGASTITMQLAKNVFLRREKTLVRKVQEVVLTWWLERSLPKERILELYLNVIEYGPSVYGLRHAAHHYFDVRPSELTPLTAGYLAVILPAPKRYGVPSSLEMPPGTSRAVLAFLRSMAERGRLPEDALAGAEAELASFRFRAGPTAPTLYEAPAPEDLDTSFGLPEAPLD